MPACSNNLKYANMRFLYFVPLIIILGSCKSPEGGLYQFDPRTIGKKEIALSELADDITYIPLDNSFPINMIYYPRYFIGDNIYLSERQSGVMIFDRNGRFIKKVGSKGRGPGEYAFCVNFSVDERSGTICVMDANVIKVYSKTGRFLRKIELREYSAGTDVLEFYNSEIFIPCHPQYTGVKHEWILFDTLGNIIKTKERSTPEFTGNCLLYTSDAADDLLCVDLGGRRIIKKKKNKSLLIKINIIKRHMHTQTPEHIYCTHIFYTSYALL